jgi:putative endonuclease
VLCRNNSIYTGVTDNVDFRFKRHKSRTGGWHTRLYPVIELLRIEKFSTKQEALKRERQIKGWRREKKLNLIKFGSPKGKQVRFQPRSGAQK